MFGVYLDRLVRVVDLHCGGLEVAVVFCIMKNQDISQPVRELYDAINRRDGNGVQSGSFGKFGPTGHSMEFHFCKVFRVQGGVILSGRSYSDSFQLIPSISHTGEMAA